MSRADRLLRAAVTGYCALTRPRRYDAQQLQDLALPLIGGASWTQMTSPALPAGSGSGGV